MAQIQCNMVSYSLEHGVDIALTLPSLSSCDFGGEKQPSHTPLAKYPVLYLLHGKGNDYQSWLRYTSIERLAEEKQIAVVTFSCGNNAYMNRPNHENYFDFLEKELPEFVCGYFPVSSRPDDTYLAGLSMGGYGTLAHALSCPERYCAFGAFSSAVRLNRFEDFSYAMDIYALLEKDLKGKKKLPYAYLACGTDDGLYGQNVEFRDKLMHSGIPVEWDALEGYEHEWKFWDIEIEKFLNWLSKGIRTDYYAALGTHKI